MVSNSVVRLVRCGDLIRPHLSGFRSGGTLVSGSEPGREPDRVGSGRIQEREVRMSVRGKGAAREGCHREGERVG